MAKPTSRDKQAQIAFWISSDLRDKLKVTAHKEGRSMNAQLRLLIADFLESRRVNAQKENKC